MASCVWCVFACVGAQAEEACALFAKLGDVKMEAWSGMDMLDGLSEPYVGVTSCLTDRVERFMVDSHQLT